MFELPRETIYVHEKDIGYYVDHLKAGNHFSIAGYSDAEWYCILGIRAGDRTGLGQIIDQKHGKKLIDVMKRRQDCNTFLFAIPRCLHNLPHFCDYAIEDFLRGIGLEIDWFERDMVTDDLAEHAELFPFIRQLQSPDTESITIIGNKHLRGLKQFLDYQHFVEISSPNLHMESGGIEKAVALAISYGKPGVYLVSAGVSAAVIIDRLHDEIKDSWFIDCGSIWDAFVGIGGQREWRAELYANPQRLEQWKRDNIYGKGK